MSRAVVRMPVVEFARGSSPAMPDGDVVRRRGVIFRSGQYDYQKFAMTPDELRRVARDFKPVPVDLGHPSSESPLDGTLGDLESVDVSPDGTTLFGVAAFPRWLEDRLGDARRSVSVSFDRATKAIRRLSLVTRPQISDAELQAAFACACGGHATVEAEPMAEQAEDKVARIRREIEELDEDELAALGGEAEEDDMDGDTEDELDAAADDTSDFAEDPEKAEMRARLAALEERDARREDERRKLLSADFAKDELRAGRILPTEAENAAALYFQALVDDDLDDGAATVNFSKGGKPVRGTRQQMVRAFFAARPSHGLAHERGVDAPGRYLLDPDAQFSGGGAAETPEGKEAWVEARLAKTSTGQAILAQRNGTRAG